MRIAQIHKTKRTSWLIASCFCVFFLALSHLHAQSVVSSAAIIDDMWPATSDATPLAKLQDFSKVKIRPIKKGKKHSFGERYSEGMAKAVQALYQSDLSGVRESLTLIDSDKDTTPLESWWGLFTYAQTLLGVGRASEAEQLIPELREREQAWIGHDLNSRALHGELMVWIGDYVPALEELGAVYRSTKDWRMPVSYGGAPDNLAEIVSLTQAQLRAMTSLSALAMQLGNDALAREWANAAEARYNDVVYVVNHWIYGMVMPGHFDIYYGRAINQTVKAAAIVALESDAAAQAIDDATQSITALGWRCGTVFLDAVLARAYLRSGDGDQALSRAKAATSDSIKAECHDFTWRIDMITGDALMRIDEPDEARKAYERAERAIGLVSGALAGDRAKLRFGIGKEHVTLRLVEMALIENDVDDAFAIAERGRARAFSDLLADRVIDHKIGVFDELKAIDDLIRASNLARMAPMGGTDSIDIEALFTKRNNLLEALSDSEPEVAELLGYFSIEIKDVQSHLVADQSMLYALPSSDSDLIRWIAIDSSGASMIYSNLTHEEVNALITDITEFGEDDLDIPQRRALKKLVTGLDLSEITGTSVFIVPSKSLYRVPWGVILTDRLVSILPSASSLVYFSRDSDVSDNDVILGDPDYGGVMPQLPGARKEAIAVGELLSADPLLSEDATEERLRTAVGNQARILHLATHGSFDPLRPLESGIYLTRSKLKTQSLFDRPLNSDTVILSACESGLGQTMAGDDYLGLARSLYLGGTRTVIHSLWPVSDQATQNFMRALYQSVTTHSIVQAWRLAVDQMVSDGYPPHISGAFVLGGSIE